MANLYGELFGSRDTSGTSRARTQGAPARDIRRLIEAEARRQGVSPALALAIARQESGLDPGAVGGKSRAGDRSLGLFQLHRPAAVDAGIDPERRGELHENIRGGVTYFKQKLQQSGGNVEQALSRYNRGTPTYKGIGDPRYVEHVLAKVEGGTPKAGLLAYVGRLVSPASAEAAPVREGETKASQQPPARAAASRSAGQGRGEQLFKALFGGQAQQTPSQTPPAVPTHPASQAPTPEAVPEATEQGAPAAPVRSKQLLDVITGSPLKPTRPALPATGSPALEAEQQQAALQPWWQRTLSTVAGASPEIATAAPDLPQIEQAVTEMSPEERTELRRREADVGKTALATGMSVGLSSGGAALGIPAGPGGVVAGEIAGSYAARKINVALGLEEPGTFGDVAAVVGPPVGRALVPAVKWGVRHLPGSQAAQHTDVAGRLGRQVEGLAPATPSHDLYSQVAQGANPPISTVRLWRTAHEILREEQRLQPSMRNPHLMRVAQDVIDMGRQGMGNVEMQQLYANQQRVGEMLRAARRTGGTEERGLRRLYGAFHDDLERAAQSGIPEADTLRTAIATSRREHAVDEMEDLFRPGRPGIVQRADGQVSISGGKLQTRFEDRLRTDRVFAGSFQPEELQEIRGILRDATRLKALPPPRGVAFGSGMVAGRTGLAYAVTQAITQDPALATAMAGIAAGGPQLLSWGLTSAPGRAIVRSALREGRPLSDPHTLMALFIASRPATTAAVEEVSRGLAPE